jgi:hypothetical protein
MARLVVQYPDYCSSERTKGYHHVCILAVSGKDRHRFKSRTTYWTIEKTVGVYRKKFYALRSILDSKP